MVMDMPSLYDAPEAYIIYNEKNHNEYYLLENRQYDGFGESNPAHGMLILHVYFNSKVWTDNGVNSSSTQRMTIIPADGKLTSLTNSGDTWPGTKGKTALTDTSTPAATLYVANSDGRKYMGKPIEDIAESIDGKISFIFNGGITIDVPVATEPSDIESDCFTAHWDAVEGATGYKVQLMATDIDAEQISLADVTLLQEDFSSFNNHKTADGTSDVSGKLDSYTTTPGWEGQKLYTSGGNDEVKMGSRSSSGQIMTPQLTTEKQVVTLSFTARNYGSDKKPVHVFLGEADNVIGSQELTSDAQRYVVTTTVEGDSFRWGLRSEGRCYISEMCAYEGEVTEEQIEAGMASGSHSETIEVQTEGTSYQFTDLSNQRKYSYSVCTIAGKMQSNWSNRIEVLLPSDEDGIVSEKGIVKGEEFTTAVYDLSGRKISSKLSTLNSQLKKGIYIINGKKYLK